MRAGEKAKVLKVERPVPTKEDLSGYVGREGLIVRRLNVPWTPEHGALWELRFDDDSVAVFSESELAGVRNGETTPSDIEDLQEAWGKAPRGPSIPFRRFGAGLGAAPAVLALFFFALAGVLLLWAGVASGNWWFAAGGAALVLIGIGAAGVLIS